MQKDTPITNNSLNSDGILGDNMELLVLHKAYLDLTEGEKDQKEDESDVDKN